MFKLFALYDSKVSSFANPVCARSDGEAIRMVTDAAADPSTLFSKHPSDFVLYCVGTYDEDTGEVAPTKLSNLGTIAALVAASKE